MTLSIVPLGKALAARDICIAWANAEWGRASRFTLDDWEAEFDRIKAHPIDEIFVAFQGNTPVGMVWLLEHEGVDTHTHLSPWLSCLVVEPTKRGRGIGAILIAHLEARATNGGDKTLYLLTETPAVYFVHGWEVMDTALLGDRRVFVMQKHLVLAAGNPP